MYTHLDLGIAQLGNLNIVHNGPRSTIVSWTPPPVEEHSDAIDGYMVICTSQHGIHSSTIINGSRITFREYTDLKPSTLYTFSVRTRTTAGYGLVAEKRFKTPEEGKA